MELQKSGSMKGGNIIKKKSPEVLFIIYFFKQLVICSCGLKIYKSF